MLFCMNCEAELDDVNDDFPWCSPECEGEYRACMDDNWYTDGDDEDYDPDAEEEDFGWDEEYDPYFASDGVE